MTTFLQLGVNTIPIPIHVKMFIKGALIALLNRKKKKTDNTKLTHFYKAKEPYVDDDSDLVNSCNLSLSKCKRLGDRYLIYPYALSQEVPFQGKGHAPNSEILQFSVSTKLRNCKICAT